MTKYVRDRECMSCGNKFTAPVVMSSHTSNLSGEATVWCPKCASRSVVSHPVREEIANERKLHTTPV